MVKALVHVSMSYWAAYSFNTLPDMYDMLYAGLNLMELGF